MAPQIASRKAAKDFLQRHPRLKGNRVFHELQRRRGYRGVQVRPELTDRTDLLEQLAGRGVAVAPDFFPPAQIEEMLAGCDEVIRRARDGELADRTFTVQPDILFRIGKVDELVPATRAFFEDPAIRSVMEANLSPRVASFRREMETRFGLSKMAQADLFHFDNWQPICKAFLYLVDVGEENAPFAYLAGSHRRAKWRLPHEVAFSAYGKHGRFGHLFPQEVRKLREDNPDWDEVVCTGTAGTLILADLRGLHRGTPLREGRRVLLNNTFDLMNA